MTPMRSQTLGSVVTILAPVSAAATANATTGGVEVVGYTGELQIIVGIGPVTAGSITGKIQHSDDNVPANFSDVAGMTFTVVNTPNTAGTVQTLVIQTEDVKRFIRYVGTIATGPAVVSVLLVGQKVYTG